MSTRTITACDRCGADITDTDHWQFGTRRSGVDMRAPVSHELLDLCGKCKTALDRFMEAGKAVAT